MVKKAAKTKKLAKTKTPTKSAKSNTPAKAAKRKSNPPSVDALRSAAKASAAARLRKGH